MLEYLTTCLYIYKTKPACTHAHKELYIHLSQHVIINQSIIANQKLLRKIFVSSLIDNIFF